MANESGITVEQIMERIRERVRSRKQVSGDTATSVQIVSGPTSPETQSLSLYDLGELRDNVAANNALWNSVGTINPRPSGLHNSAVQFVKKLIARLLTWYTRPLHQFNSSVTRSLNETTRAVENLQKNLAVLNERSSESQESTWARLETLQEQLAESQATQQTATAEQGERLSLLEQSTPARLEALQNQLGGLEASQKTLFAAVSERLTRMDETLTAEHERTDQQFQELATSQKSLSETVSERLTRMDETLTAEHERTDQRFSILEQQLSEAQTESRKRMQDIRIETLSTADSGKGSKAAEGLWFNEPVMVHYEENGKASWGGTHERIIEKAWVLRQLARIPLSAKLLDIGCTESILSIELASSGFQVTGIDVRPYPLEHPSFMFVRADLCNSQLEPESYDVIIALSAIEHIGLGFYGDPVGKSSDKTAMREVYRLLKPGGQLLITVPFGVRAVLPLHRIYDRALLRGLLRRFKIEKIEFGVRLDDKTWVTPATKKKAAAQKHHPHTHLPSAVAMAVCTKPKRSQTRRF